MKEEREEWRRTRVGGGSEKSGRKLFRIRSNVRPSGRTCVRASVRSNVHRSPSTSFLTTLSRSFFSSLCRHNTTSTNNISQQSIVWCKTSAIRKSFERNENQQVRLPC